MIDVSVGLCTHNRKGVLEKVLLTLADQTLSPDRFEAVLVDDGSTDGTAQMARELQGRLPYPLVYCHQRHSGLATARNTGIRAASGRVIVYIDDDVLADPRLLEEHLKSHDRYEKCVVNGWVNHVTEAERPEKPRFTMADISTSFFWTSNVSVKRQHLLAAGLFDEVFREYGWEDQEMGLRLMALGLEKRNNYKAIGYHVKRPPRLSDVRRALAQAEAKGRTAVIYVRKHPRLRCRFATGIHPPRLAWQRLLTSGGVLERYCRRTLGLDGEQRPDRELTSHEAWCLRELSSIHYFRTIQQGG